MPYSRRRLSPDAFLKICPSRPLLARIGEKWALMILVALEAGPLRFGGLMQRLQGISQKMLSQTARNLERDGLVVRKVIDARPLRVEYSLTSLGLSLLPAARALKSWAEAHLRETQASNKMYDAKLALRSAV
jgi:DNA-binding HxlR family transcriptional regulator